MKRTLKPQVILVLTLFIGIICLILLLLPKDIFLVEFKPVVKIGLRENINSNKVKMCYGSKYFFNKSSCEDISSNIKVTGEVDINNVGNYVLVYTIDYKGISRTLNQTIIVYDNESPVIDFLGQDGVNKCIKGNIYEPPFKATDTQDGDLTNKVKRKIDGDYYVYSVSDSSGNKAVARRFIIKNDVVHPRIELTGGSEIYLVLNEEYVEPGFVVSDNCDQDINEKVIISGTVNSQQEGTYFITYEVTDASNNYTSVVRKVIVGKQKQVIENKVVYLTFDDGPSIYTEKILDVLKKYDIKATYFVTAQFPKYLPVLNRIHNEGHSIGLHSYSHVFKKIYANENNFFADIDKLNEVIKEHTGAYSKILRFAGGGSNRVSKFNPGIMTRLAKRVTEKGYIYFDWNVDSQDTSLTDSNKIADTVIKQLKGKQLFYIVLQHDNKIANVKSLEKIIEFGLENGYVFKPLSTNSPDVHQRINN